MTWGGGVHFTKTSPTRTPLPKQTPNTLTQLLARLPCTKKTPFLEILGFFRLTCFCCCSSWQKNHVEKSRGNEHPIKWPCSPQKLFSFFFCNSSGNFRLCRHKEHQDKLRVIILYFSSFTLLPTDVCTF